MARFFLFVCLSLWLARPHAQELSIEHSVKVEFPTQAGYDYTVYSTTDPNQQSGWKPLGLISHATGEKATFFYQTSPDQKVFFKDFAAAFEKLETLGTKNLTPLDA